MSRKRSLLHPPLLGLLTFALILLALWPESANAATLVLAARDLGAGAALMPADLAPLDAVSDPAALVGQTLAVARFQGEPITPRHLAPRCPCNRTSGPWPCGFSGTGARQ